MLAKNELNTNDDDIKLVFPNVDRDAPRSVEWLSGEVGHSTMLLMGNSEKDSDNIINMPYDQKLIEERNRVKEFIENTGELNWTIQYKGNPVGEIWVDLKDKVINLENGKKTIDREKKCCAANEKIGPANIHGMVVEITPKPGLQTFCHHNTGPDPYLTRFGSV